MKIIENPMIRHMSPLSAEDDLEDQGGALRGPLRAHAGAAAGGERGSFQTRRW